MARKGVAILREIAMVKSSLPDGAIKVAMLKELNDELSSLYAFKGAQGVLPLESVGIPAGDAVKPSGGRK